MKKSKVLRRIRQGVQNSIFMLALLCLAACGYQIQGERVLPMKKIYMDWAQYEPFSVALKVGLIKSGAQMTPQLRDAEAVVRILSFQREKNSLSLNQRGQTRDFGLGLKLIWQVEAWKEGQMLGFWVQPSTLELKREIHFNDVFLLAKADEEAQLYQDLQDDLLQQMLQRLSVATILMTDH